MRKTQSETMKYYQQGDVVMIKRETIPSHPKLKGKVLQEGEHTGHAHRITSGNAVLFADPEGNKFMRVAKGGASITHEEHLPVDIEEGEYEIRIVRQKDPFSKIVSKVVD